MWIESGVGRAFIRILSSGGQRYVTAAALIANLQMLVVEDNPADVFFFSEAIKATRVPANLHVVGDGVDAMRFLLREPPFADAPRPDVVVLDLNLPLKGGREVLFDMMADPTLRDIPVAILTTSDAEASLCDHYTVGRCQYFVKTSDLRRLQSIVGQIAEYARSNLGH